MDNRAIGVFDSGLGGLTAVKALNKLLPNEDIVYFGDNARAPYGSRSKETIIKYATQDMEFLLEMNVKAVVVACGTVSSTAIDILRKRTSLPIIGVIEPAAKKAVELTRNKKVAVLATNATISSHAFSRKVSELDANIFCIEKACPLFAPLVENGYIDKDNVALNAIISDYLESVIPHGADTYVLGCTHFPIIKDPIQLCVGDARLIDSGEEISYAVQNLMLENGISADRDRIGHNKFYVSENPDGFSAIANVFMNKNIHEYEVCLVDISAKSCKS